MSKESKKVISAKDFLSTRKVGGKVNLGKRKKIEFTEDFGRFTKGGVSELFGEKADYYIQKGIAKEVK